MSDIDPALAPYAEVFAAIAARAPLADTQGATLDIEIGWLRDADMLTAALPVALTGTVGWADRPLEVAACLRALGRVSLPVGRLYEGHVNAAQLIGLYGTPRLQRQTTAAVRAGALLGVWGADSSDPVSAIAEGDGFFLNGAKAFCSGLGLVQLALVSAAVGGGTRLFAVTVDELSRADIGTWSMSGMQATASGTYRFCNLKVDAEAVVGNIDDYYREPYFLGGMFRMGAVQVGGIDALIDAFVAHLISRGNADDPIQLYRLGECGSLQAMAAAVVTQVAQDIARSTAPADIAYRAILMREGVEHCATEILRRIERGAGTAAYGSGGNLDRIRRDIGLYIRQGALDIRLKAAGATIVRTPID